MLPMWALIMLAFFWVNVITLPCFVIDACSLIFWRCSWVGHDYEWRQFHVSFVVVVLVPSLLNSCHGGAWVAEFMSWYNKISHWPQPSRP